MGYTVKDAFPLKTKSGKDSADAFAYVNADKQAWEAPLPVGEYEVMIKGLDVYQKPVTLTSNGKVTVPPLSILLVREAPAPEPEPEPEPNPEPDPNPNPNPGGDPNPQPEPGPGINPQPNPQGPASGPTKPTHKPSGKVKGSVQDRSVDHLATTGAGVPEMVLISLLLGAAGVVLVFRARKRG